ncbi:ER-bound oxygenase mpaB' [Exophiala dermatitidis]
MDTQSAYPFFSNLTTASSQRLSGLSRIWAYYLLPAIIAYPFLCRALRFRRIKALQAKYKYGTPEHPSYEGMTVDEAHNIIRITHDVEFPALFDKGLQFALFRTYGIPTINDLLVKTTQLAKTQNVPRRYADTAVLLADIYAGEPTSDRCTDAFARLNYLHGHYIKQGKISNDDMLYTLSLFLNQPVEWINRYEWRQLTDLEICAMGVFHKAMGDAMDISFEALPSYSTGWKDGLHFYRELDAWAKQYEKNHMIPDKKNYDTAVETRKLLLSTYPTFLHGVLTKAISAPLDDRLREAVMFEKAPPLYVTLLNGFMGLRKLYLGYLALPRPWAMRPKLLSEKPDRKGRRYVLRWNTMPVYVKPTLWNRWGPGALVNMLLGVPRPGDQGMYPEGFEVKDVGPPVFVGKGSKEMDATKQRLQNAQRGGCPFAVR